MKREMAGMGGRNVPIKNLLMPEDQEKSESSVSKKYL